MLSHHPSSTPICQTQSFVSNNNVPNQQSNKGHSTQANLHAYLNFRATTLFVSVAVCPSNRTDLHSGGLPGLFPVHPRGLGQHGCMLLDVALPVAFYGLHSPPVHNFLPFCAGHHSVIARLVTWCPATSATSNLSKFCAKRLCKPQAED